MTARTTVPLRRAVLLSYLREHPWVTSRMLSDIVLRETGGPPSALTGAVYVPPWIVYADLRVLEDAGEVERRQFSKRTILWNARWSR